MSTHCLIKRPFNPSSSSSKGLRNLLPSHSAQSSSYPIPPLSSYKTLLSASLKSHFLITKLQKQNSFFTKMAVISPITFSAVSNSALKAAAKKKAPVTYIEGLNSYGGLKVQNTVSSLGVLRCADKSFAMVVSSIKSSSSEKSRGGAFSSTCSAGAEIFKIAAIMNGLVLVGVAFGFILLRVEALFEESE